jgi:hypothetical protein
MIKAVSYSRTKGSEKFKEFLAKPFIVDMLFPISDKSVETLFEDWRGKDMLRGWSKFTSDDFTLEFYPTYYTIKKNKPVDSIKYMTAIPATIDDFITDMNGFAVPLYWTEWIDLNFEPKEYLCVEEIKEYFTDLLEKMGKSHELL